MIVIVPVLVGTNADKFVIAAGGVLSPGVTFRTITVSELAAIIMPADIIMRVSIT